MFHFLSTELLPFRPCSYGTTIHPYFLQNPSLKSISAHFSSLLRNPSPTSSTHPSDATTHPSPTVSYLMNSFGLSSAEALSISKKVQLETSERPDSVLTFLRAHGFTDTQIVKIITKRPRLLLANAEKTLKPKWVFLRSLGLSDPKLADVFSVNPSLFCRNLEKKIIPYTDFLKSILHTAGDVAHALKFSGGWLPLNYYPNYETLKDLRMPDSSMARLLNNWPRALSSKTDEFNEIVAVVREMGLDPSTLMFVHAIGVVSFIGKEKWEKNWALYRSLGWSDHEVRAVFRKLPFCLAMSDENIKQKVDFFVNKLGWSPAFISGAPSLLLASLERRLIPRCAVLKILMSRGLINKDANLRWILVMAKKDFLEKFVVKYEREVPEVMEASQGQVAFAGWDLVSECVPLKSHGMS